MWQNTIFIFLYKEWFVVKRITLIVTWYINIPQCNVELHSDIDFMYLYCLLCSSVLSSLNNSSSCVQLMTFESARKEWTVHWNSLCTERLLMWIKCGVYYSRYGTWVWFGISQNVSWYYYKFLVYKVIDYRLYFLIILSFQINYHYT